MAFFGIFLVGILLWFVLVIIALVVLFIFIPCLIIAIINLIKGIKNNWPKRNIIPLAITGPIALIFIILFTVYFIWRFGFYVDPNATSSSIQIVSNLLFLPKL